MTRKIVASLLILTVTWTPSWAAGPDSATSPEPESQTRAARLDFDLSLGPIIEQRSAIDRSSYDLDELLETLDFDAAAIVDFVSDQIRFEQYQGLLRGAQGTLMSSAGNALDQAVLLATLLNNAGFDARIQRSVLSESEARRLVQQMQPRQSSFDIPERPLAKQGRNRAASTSPAFRTLEFLSTPGESWVPPDPLAVNRISQQLTSLLEESGVSLDSGDGLAQLTEEARDYFWVQCQTEAAAPWVDYHPAFSDRSKRLENDPSTETLRDQIPAELQHRIEIQSFIEQKTGNQLLVHPIMDPWVSPTANLVGKNLILSIFPTGASRETLAAGWKEVLEQSTLFVPMLNGELPRGAKAFDRNGIVFGLDSLGMDQFGATALFQSVGGRAEDAAAALGSLGDVGETPEEEPLALTALWIDFTIHKPSGKSEFYRRYVMDRLGAAGREAGNLRRLASEAHFRSLISSRQISVTVGNYPKGLVEDRLLYQLETDLSLRLRASASKLTKEEALQILDTDYGLATFVAFESNPLRGADLLVYRDEPGLLTRGMGLSSDPNQEVVEFVDIIHNSRRTWRSRASRVEAAPFESLTQGVWDTLNEGIALHRGSGPTEVQSTASYFERAQAEGIDLVLLAPGRNDLETLKIAADSRMAVARELEAGRVVVIPERQPTDANRAAWWRIDPETGESLGMVEGVGGAVSTGYLVVLAGALIALNVLLGMEVHQQYEEYVVCERKIDEKDVPNLALEDAYACGCRIMTRSRRYAGWAGAWKFCEAAERLWVGGCFSANACAAQTSPDYPMELRDDLEVTERCLEAWEEELQESDAYEKCRPHG